MKAMSGNHTPSWGDSGAGRGCNNQKSRIDTLPGINIPGVKMETSHKYRHITTLRSGFLRRLVVLATCLLLLLGLAASGSATVVTLTVQLDEDDAFETGYGPADWDNSSDPYLRVLQYNSGSEKNVGVRFSGVTVPQGSTINSATFKPYMANHTNDYLYCKIYGHAVDNSEDFSSTPYIKDTGYRSRTTANYSFSLNDQGDGYKSYTVTSIVQEIVNRSGWVSGYALSLLMIGNTSSTSREAQFYSVNGYPGAQLVIDYTPPSPNLNQAHYRWRNDNGLEQGVYDTITVNNSSSNSYTTTGSSSLSLSHTVNAGSNRFMLVGVTLGKYSLGTLPTVTGVTMNSGALTGTIVTSADSSSYVRTYIYQFINPPTGSNTILVSLSGTLSSNQLEAVVGAVTYNNVDQTTPIRSYNSGTGASTNISVAVSSQSGDRVFGLGGTRLSGITFTTIGGTEHWNVSANNCRRTSGGSIASSSTSVTHSWTNTGGSYWAAVGASIKPNASSAQASWAANEDTALTGLTKSTIKRLRFLVSNTGAGSSTATYQLQSAQAATCSSGTYAAVPTDTSGTWKISASSYYADAAASVNIDSGLTDPASKTFVAGQLKDTGNTTGSITLSTTQFTEIEYAVQATDNAVLGLPYCFQLYDTTAGRAMDTKTVYAQATLEPMSLTQGHYRWRNDDGGEATGYQTVQVANSYYGTVSNGTTLTVSNVAASGAYRMLLVGISYYPGASNVSVQSVSWNSQSLGAAAGGGTFGMYAGTAVYKLVAPAVATSNLTITFSGATYAVAGVLALTGVDQATP